MLLGLLQCSCLAFVITCVLGCFHIDLGTITLKLNFLEKPPVSLHLSIRLGWDNVFPFRCSGKTSRGRSSADLLEKPSFDGRFVSCADFWSSLTCLFLNIADLPEAQRARAPPPSHIPRHHGSQSLCPRRRSQYHIFGAHLHRG